MSELIDDLVAEVQNGLMTIDEARAVLGLPAFGLPETSEPIVYTTQGPMTLARANVLVRQKTEVTSHLSPSQVNDLVRQIQAQLLKNARSGRSGVLGVYEQSSRTVQVMRRTQARACCESSLAFRAVCPVQ